ncbi:sodium/potassium-transporting ATPase subunit beta-2-like isoform X2 [Hemiscyllium ocellatum]|uniref:sodium/potassium-transporting ATPase subunit beta-2-like isoform X2 n=1 Tax=Hemiscyllium ocellatum TaxID=170820 RepID=UPI0029673893|nr:sodium/potassium-transporting ATPase subunit beta-2-like isoform X2 [Hemiscyllium ocellatum]
MAPKVKKSFGQTVHEWGEFLWNSRTQEFLGRTGSSWALILMFYAVFYTFLTGLFSLTMWVMLQTVNEYTPKYQDRITNPGLMIRPRTDSLLVTFNTSHESTWQAHVQALNAYLDSYNDSVQVSNNDQCRPGTYYLQEDSGDVRNTPKRSCQFNRTMLGQCSGLEDKTYGYSEGKPCILVKMNKIIGFLPGEGKTPYVSCEGKTKDNDKVHNLQYFPPNGTLDLMYFPYYGKKAHVNYTQPLVAVKFVNITNNVDVNIECKVYGSNVRNDDERDKFAGRVVFTLNVGSGGTGST